MNLNCSINISTNSGLVTDMDYKIRKIKETEYPLLKDFLYEAIFVPDGVEPPPKSIVDAPELQVYISGFGSENGFSAQKLRTNSSHSSKDSIFFAVYCSISQLLAFFYHRPLALMFFSQTILRSSSATGTFRSPYL